MGSFTQSSGNLASHLAHADVAHSINLDKPPSVSNPHSLFTSSHEIQELHPLHSDKANIKITSRSREILMSSTDTDIDGMLDITLHHARDIHNICIYGKQDVYAKFSITHTQDTVYSTQPVRGGGKNPVFNQSLQILISKLDAVLKCELWMMSCARNYLEDQLLGFVLVPLCELMGTGKSTRDYALSSTDLFHTPAGMVCLSLMFYHRGTDLLLSAMDAKLAVCENTVSSGQTQGQKESMENGNPDTKGSHGIAVVDYDSIEFPDLQVASENQQLVSMYMKMASDDSNMEEDMCDGHNLQQQDGIQVHPYAVDDSMLQSSTLEGDCEMALNNGGDEKYDAHIGSSESASDDTGMLGYVELSSPSTNQPISQATKTTVSKQEVSGMQTKDFNNSGCNNSSQATPSPRSVSSSGGLSSSDDNKTMGSSDGQESVSSFTAPPPLISLPLDPEVTVVQQDIVDMYMKSMQQFTESLAKMKLPFDIDGAQNSVELTSESQSEKKGAASERGGAVKDGHKVFYGSRAFF